MAHETDTCNGGFQVRRESCQKLGPGPYDPLINPNNFTTKIDNPYFPLVPGTTFTYLTPNGAIKDVFAVTHDTRVIDGVTCVQVNDSVFTNETLTQDTLDFFAQDNETAVRNRRRKLTGISESGARDKRIPSGGAERSRFSCRSRHLGREMYRAGISNPSYNGCQQAQRP